MGTKNYILTILVFMMSGQKFFSQDVTIREEKMVMTTYMFSDPSPVPQIGRLYPYFRFDGYTDKSEEKAWNMVILENDFIKVYVCPDIGGKIWGAVEKSTGKEFMYYNHVVKFRDVAMRGAWTSGGLEYNFGDIGHIPTCATPVDYKLKKNKDGSVSCIVGALDLPSRTNWNVEIKLEKDKAYFETIATWTNNTNVPVTYYHWMNAAAKADGNLEFLYPGNKRIGHGGELGEWPIDQDRDISFYKNNDFGIYKSYHVINSYSNYFGGYWHDDDFGFGHLSTYEDKPGKKIWIWGLSDQGMIWEDLLTDSDGQYIEYQSGKLFNQAAHSSTYTPFKHREFLPQDIDVMSEKWFPLKATKGMVAASEKALLNVEIEANKLTVRLSALQPLMDELIVSRGQDTLVKIKISLNPLELYEQTIEIENPKDYNISFREDKLSYSTQTTDLILDRPVQPSEKFNWQTAYGKYLQALEFEKQRRYSEAMDMYHKSHKEDPGFAPTLDRLALGYYRLMDYEQALEYATSSLAIDTYGGLANYIYGLVQTKKNKKAEAKSSFSIAAQSVTFRSAAYIELAKIFLKENAVNSTEYYSEKALVFNNNSITALEMLALVYRKQNKQKEALDILDRIVKIDALSHFANAERYFQNKISKQRFKSQITNELPFETYLELALKYRDFGHNKEAVEILKMAPQNPVVLLWLAHLEPEHKKENLQKALDLSPEMIFPHRKETAEVLKKMMEARSHWKLKYYLGLINWNKGLIKQAQELFSSCGTEPNSIAFYLAKIQLFKNNKAIVEQSVERALDIDPSNWRVNQIKAEQHLEKSEYKEAKKIAKRFMGYHPEKAQFGMLYAKALMGQKLYDESITFLNTFNVLPYEGATEGRAIYHEAGIKAAYKALQNKKYTKAIGYAQKAKLWPINLGVGKHYDVDERLDDFIIAFSLEKLGKDAESKEQYKKIANHVTLSYLSESSKLYLQLKALEKLGNKEKVFPLLNESIKNDADNKYLKWVEAKYRLRDSDTIKDELLNSNTEIQVYDTKFVDTEFRLVLEFLLTVKL